MASSPTAPQLRVLESSRVAPPRGSVPDASLPFVFFDVVWLHVHPVERVFFYQFPHSTSHFLHSALPDLKSSLSLTLQHFYPLAGRIRLVPGSDDRHEIHYVDGDSVAFVVAECEDEDFDELSGSHARDPTRLLPFVTLLPRSADAQPLLTIQVTVFPNHGFVIGLMLHHAACDGSSLLHFLSSWAACCSSGSSVPVSSAPPVLDRALIPDPRGLYSIFHKAISGMAQKGASESSQEDSKEPSGGDKVIASFNLESDQIKRLKELFSAKAAPPGDAGAPFHCSSITVAFAYVWVCLIKARGYDSERSCHLLVPTNCRSRLRPPVPSEYFGNCLGYCVVEAKAGDLLGRDGFVTAAKAISKSIELFKEDALHGAEEWLEKFASIVAQKPLSVASSPQFKVYSLDFGWGRPKKMEVVSIMKGEAMSVAESRDGGGGLEIGFVLPKQEMEDFAAHFNHAYDCLFH